MNNEILASIAPFLVLFLTILLLFVFFQIRVRKIDGPFSMKHLQSAVPGGYYTRMPIFFNPNKKGNHSGYIVLDVGQMGQSLNIALRGEAV